MRNPRPNVGRGKEGKVVIIIRVAARVTLGKPLGNHIRR